MQGSNQTELDWKQIGLIILCVRFVQGWIFWGGATRRFIYDPQKLNPNAHSWMANKLQSAMPGALFGLQSIISFLLHHFYLLYISIIIFSLIELFTGIALILGGFTRFAALISIFLSISLMLIFGWQGSTCVDEWTMVVSNLAMGFTLLLSGAPIYSLDSWLLKRYPTLQNKWFVNIASGPWKYNKLKNISIISAIFTILFTLITYDYYRGAIISAYHAGPTSPKVIHLQLTNATIHDNAISFSIYVNAGSPAESAYIVKIELLKGNKIIQIWNAQTLSQLNIQSIQNDYAYNRITTNAYGLVAPVSAKAIITLPITSLIAPGVYHLRIYTVDGKQWETSVLSKGKGKTM